MIIVLKGIPCQGQNVRECMRGKGKKPDRRVYTLKLIPHQGETVRSLNISIRALKAAAGAAAAVLLVLLGALGYSAYSYFGLSADGAKLKNLEQTNGSQQEQLKALAKEASELQGEMEKLTELEKELNRLVDEDGASGHHTGQGGPFVAPDVSQVKRALDTVSRSLPERRENLARLQERLVAQKEKQKEQAAEAEKLARTSVPGNIPAGWPTTGEISSPFGLRWNGSDFHPGIDIADDTGTPIMATADGVVTDAGWNSGGYGNKVDIDHGNGIMTRYGHASEVIVHAGQHVKRGQVIAYMGSTGFSTGPHLHYEVRVNGEPVNPASYL